MASNLQPFVEGTGGPGPNASVPNLVRAGFEEIGEVFEPGSADLIFSNRLPNTSSRDRALPLDWERAANGSYQVLAPGGRVALNVWESNPAVVEMIVNAFRRAGFRNVGSTGTGAGTMITAVR